MDKSLASGLTTVTPAGQPLVGKPRGSAAQQALAKLGLKHPIDFALYLPLRYEDETRIQSLDSISIGETIQIAARVASCAVKPGFKRQLLVTVAVLHWPPAAPDTPLSPNGERCTLRFFHFYPAQQKAFVTGSQWRIRGSLQRGAYGLEMVHPVCHPLSCATESALPKRLTPVYPSTARLPQNYLRKAIAGQLAHADLGPTIPQDLEQNTNPTLKWSLKDAIHFLHHPPADTLVQALEERTHPAWQRLIAEELLAQQLSQKHARQKRLNQQAPQLGIHLPAARPLTQALLEVLPFHLTTAQARIYQEIADDLNQKRPMHRLLQGDVGSGKTVLAALACAQAIGAGYQCALMVPTEILTEQHFRKLTAWFAQLGEQVAWLTGSQKKSERKLILEDIAQGKATLVVGTHAVIAKEVQFSRLGLVVIDEQHRFGVAQRLRLRNKMPNQALEPHFLMMSATPIPRTLAMSYYADLDVSTLDESPPGRQPVLTKLLSIQRKTALIERIKAQVDQGRQVYWVCPLVEESESLDLSAATATHAQLQESLYSEKGVERRVGLLHARMPALEKQMVMRLFVQGRIQVLVSTTVIEVGIDVPRASLMVIEHAERFGLSQLHQLRGRVGRGHTASTCILLYSKGEGGHLGQTAKHRLQAMLQSNDGFEIARRDLAIRGPGEFLGARQSGQTLLRFADVQRDTVWLKWARQLAPVMLAQYPQHAQRHIQRWLGVKNDYWSA